MITFTRNKINFKVHKFNELILSVLSCIVISDKWFVSFPFLSYTILSSASILRNCFIHDNLTKKLEAFNANMFLIR